MTARFQKIVYRKGKIPEKIFWTIIGYIKEVSCYFLSRKYDVFIFFYGQPPLVNPFFEWLYTKIAKKVIYDIDDLVYLRDGEQCK